MSGYEGLEQAVGCSADIIGEMVVGSYGSQVLDMQMARFVPARPATMVDGILCDACITGLLTSGSLVVELKESRDDDMEPSDYADLITIMDALIWDKRDLDTA
jgi:hypothetical protein